MDSLDAILIERTRKRPREAWTFLYRRTCGSSSCSNRVPAFGPKTYFKKSELFFRVPAPELPSKVPYVWSCFSSKKLF